MGPDLPDNIRQEINRQIKEYLYILIGTHLTAFVAGGVGGFFMGRFSRMIRD
jgi:hypothetical protein